MALPVSAILGQLVDALGERGVAVLSAPPGTGKSTLVPLALADAPWLGAGRVLVLEPRRLAARAVARRLAQLAGEPVGRRVGHRMRGDTVVSDATVVEVVTEGVLTRMVVADPALDGVGAVVFDEFHERSLDADLGLALCLEARTALRPDLRLLVMSATLDVEGLVGALATSTTGGAEVPVIEVVGRTHPVDVRWVPPPPRPPGGRAADHESAVADVVRRALAEVPAGDVLVFLPGAGEIRRVAQRLGGSPAAVLPLHGGLAPAEQDRALAPDPAGRRKVVLATTIAQTSLTIEGVTVVVDGGYTRVARFDPRRGLGGLHTQRVSRAVATQRTGCRRPPGPRGSATGCGPRSSTTTWPLPTCPRWPRPTWPRWPWTWPDGGTPGVISWCGWTRHRRWPWPQPVTCWPACPWSTNGAGPRPRACRRPGWACTPAWATPCWPPSPPATAAWPVTSPPCSSSATGAGPGPTCADAWPPCGVPAGAGTRPAACAARRGGRRPGHGGGRRGGGRARPGLARSGGPSARRGRRPLPAGVGRRCRAGRGRPPGGGGAAGGGGRRPPAGRG